MKRIAIYIVLLTCFGTTTLAAEGYDYSARWKAWDINIQRSYIIGVKEGIEVGYFTTIGNLSKDASPNDEIKIMNILKYGSSIDTNKIIEVMSDMYNDPANSYINNVKMFVLAQDKIEGKDISKLLEVEREKAYNFIKLNKK